MIDQTGLQTQNGPHVLDERGVDISPDVPVTYLDKFLAARPGDVIDFCVFERPLRYDLVCKKFRCRGLSAEVVAIL